MDIKCNNKSCLNLLWNGKCGAEEVEMETKEYRSEGKVVRVTVCRSAD